MATIASWRRLRLAKPGWLVFLSFWWLTTQAQQPPASAGQGAGVANPEAALADTRAREQMNPKEPVLSNLGLPTTEPRVEVRFAIALVPDPRVPRHRRSYDNTLTAIVQGMLHAQHVLDRYAFPWQQKLQSNKPESEPVSSDDAYGLMIFRRDAWRYQAAGSDLRTQFIALYIVPETATYGVQSAALAAAMAKIDEQNVPGCTACKPPNWPAAASASCRPDKHTIVLYGPSFSGSMDSLQRLTRADKTPGAPTCRMQARSASTTARTNELAAMSAATRLDFASLAISDDRKMLFLDDLRKELGVHDGGGNSMAIFYETSVFGLGICPREQSARMPHICRIQIPFPANIADIRYGMRRKTSQRRIELADPFVKPSRHLPLEDEAENGNEFPDSYQSRLTSVANQLDLDEAIAAIRDKRPRIIMVVATDIRDRLFLFEQLRLRISNVLLIDLETDRLLGHPEYVNVSRGALTLASSELESRVPTSQEGAGSSPPANTWSTDPQALLALAVCSRQQLMSGDVARCPSPIPSGIGAPSRPVRLHVVTRTGLKSASSVRHACEMGYPETWWVRCSGPVPMWIGAVSLLAALVTCGLWVHQHARGRPAVLKCFDVRALGLSILVVPVLFARGSAIFVAALLYAIQVCGLWALFVRYARVSGTMATREVAVASSHITARWNWNLLPSFFSISLLILFAMELSRAIEQSSGSSAAAEQLRTLRAALTTDATSGLAYSLALAVAAATILYAFAATLAYIATAQRNRFVADLQPVVTQDPAATGGPRTRIMRLGRKLDQVQEHFGDCSWTLAALVGVLVVVLLVGLVYRDGTRLTLYGGRAAMTAFIALLLVTTVTIVMWLAAVYVASRISIVSYKTAHAMRPPENGKPRFDWAPLPGERPDFAMTPILASPQQAGTRVREMMKKVLDWKAQLARISSTDPDARAQAGIALYALLASSMTIYRLSVFGCAASAVAAATIVYLLPVAESDYLLLVNIGVLLAVGLHSGFLTMHYESDELLSNVLCNRPKQTRYSFALFGFVAFPFVMLIVAIAITQIPGVLNWGDGIFDLLIKLTRPELLND